MCPAQDPDRCIDALISMGVLVPGGDRVAIRRTATFFLNSFQVRSSRAHFVALAPFNAVSSCAVGLHALCEPRRS